MDFALRRLQSCHLSGNCPRRAPQVQAQATTAAAATNAPISLAQRALLQTAAKRKLSQQQQQGQEGQQQLQQQQRNSQLRLSPELRGSLFRAHQLADSSPEEFEQLMTEHELRLHQQQQLQRQQQHHQQQQQLLQPSRQRHSHAPQHGATPAQPQHVVQQQQPQQAPPTAESEQQRQQRLLRQKLELELLLRQQKQRKRQLQLQVRREPAVLTQLIKHSTSWQRLSQLFNNLTPLFNPIHVSAAITHLAQLQEQQLAVYQSPAKDSNTLALQQFVRDLTAAAVACIPDFGPRQIANSLWAINRLGCGSLVTRKLRNAFLEAFVEKLQYAAPQHVSMVAAAVANLGWASSTSWRSAILNAVPVRLPYFKPLELATLLHAVSRLGVAPSNAWLAGVLSACYGNMHSFSLQELSMLGVGLAKLQHRPDQQWLAAYMHAVQVQLKPLAAAAGAPGSPWPAQAQQQLQWHADPGSSDSSSAGHHQHGLGTAAVSEDGPAAHGDGDSDSSEWAAEEEEPVTGVQPLVNVLWVLAKWQVVPPGAWQACCVAAVEQAVSDLTMQGVSTLLWACAKLQTPLPRQLVLRLLRHAQPLLRCANSTDVAMLAWAVGTLGLTAGALAAVRQAPTALSLSRGSSDGPSWGSYWLDDFTYHSYRLLPGASAADVASLLVGAVRMQLRPGSQWMSSVMVEAWHRLPEMTPVQLTSVLLCMARLPGCKPGQGFLQDYCTHSRTLLAATAATAAASAAAGAAPGQRCYTPQCLANTLGGLALLGFRPPQQWCGAFFDASAALLPGFNGRDFAYTMWALALLGMRPPQAWMDSYLVQLRGHVPTMTSQQLSAVIWALAQLQHRPGVDWMNRFLDRVVALTPPQGESGVLAAAAGSSGGSSSSEGGRAGGKPAPPTPLQLSGYFSAIILQGLTAWAASSLDLGFDGSSDSSGRSSGSSSDGGSTVNDHDRGSAAATRQVQPPKQPPVKRRVLKRKVQQGPSGGPATADQAPGLEVDRSVGSDGSIMFRF